MPCPGSLADAPSLSEKALALDTASKSRTFRKTVIPVILSIRCNTSIFICAKGLNETGATLLMQLNLPTSV